MATDAEGCAAALCLADHPRAAGALEMLSTGEFLSAEGEAWVLEQGAETGDAVGGSR